MGYDPPPLAEGGEPGLAGKVGEDEGVGALEGVVGPDEVGAALGEVAEGADAAPAHCVEHAEAAAASAEEGGGEDAEVAPHGALAAEEGIAGLELDAALRLPRARRGQGSPPRPRPRPRTPDSSGSRVRVRV